MSTPPRSNSRPDPDATEATAGSGQSVSEELTPEDFYYEGPYVVFTAAYHLRRGYCCHSGCRHCPYDDLA